MSKPAISVRGLSKLYQLGATLKHDTLRDHIAHAVRSVTRSLTSKKAGSDKPKAELKELWALKDVSFDVQPGEIFGIIGRNGAGKSTLLKILSQITDPTDGEIRIRGRIASLLEVGTGFHPELTGRENIFLNGAILGMTRAEIRNKLDEIIDFSGVEKFLDTPVKRYSSGMYVRLAFAVASNLDPDILLIDEVLAVGDAEFQKRCMRKMDNVANDGKTVLLISHNLGVITSVCNSAIVLDSGSIAFHGPANEAVQAYNSNSQSNLPKVELWDHPNRTPRMKPALVSAQLESQSGNPTSHFTINDSWTLSVSFVNQSPHSFFGLGFSVYTTAGVRVGGFNTCMASPPPNILPQSGIVRFRLKPLDLCPGDYMIKLSVGGAQQGFLYDEIDNALRFEVETEDIYQTGMLLTPQDGVHVFRASSEILDQPVTP